MILRVDCKETLKQILNCLNENDILVIPSIKILGTDKEQAFKRYMQLFDDGIFIFSIQEPFLNII